MPFHDHAFDGHWNPTDSDGRPLKPGSRPSSLGRSQNEDLIQDRGVASAELASEETEPVLRLTSDMVHVVEFRVVVTNFC